MKARRKRKVKRKGEAEEQEEAEREEARSTLGRSLLLDGCVSWNILTYR